MTLPLVLIYPLGTAVLGKLMINRIQRQQADRENRENYRILIELTPGIIYRIREDGSIDFISQAIQQLGYDPAELIGTPLADLLHPDDRVQFQHLLVEKRIGERRIQNLDVRFLHKNQSFQDYALNFSFVQVSARGYWDVPDTEIMRPDKQFLYTLGIAHDISIRKQAEKELRESEKRTALLKEVASAANAAATPEDALQVAVDGISRYMGWPLGHVYLADEKNPDIMVPTTIWFREDHQRFKRFQEMTRNTVFSPGKGMVGRIVADQKTLWIENIALHPDFLRRKNSAHEGLCSAFGFPVVVGKKVMAVLEFFSPEKEPPNPSLIKLMDEIGNQIGIVIERKQNEKELTKLSWAVDHSPATVVITDVNGKIQYANPKFTELTGYTIAEAVGKNPNILNSGYHSKQFYKELWQTILSGQSWYGTFCNKGKDNAIYWERASISPILDEKGEISSFVAIKEDITKLLEYEEALRQAKESAERANSAKSDFLASMSHELRTPLNAIIGFSDVLKEQYFGPLTDKQKDYIDDILESGLHLLALINDILDLAKVEAGKMELELSTITVSDLILNSLNMIKEKSMRHQIQLETKISNDVETLNITADERKLKQVMYNLLSNAAKFTPDGGSICVSAELKRKKGSHIDFLAISVKDTGIGVAFEDQKKIFEPFYQASGTRQGKSPGTGLGLPLSRDLIELHGGILYLESDGKDCGSAFTFKIPVTRETDSTPD